MTLRSLTGWLLGIVAAGLLAGCNSSASGVPAQGYLTWLEAFGRTTGAVHGRVRFPSEYTQRSVTLTLDGETFVTHPDGRFRITRLPAGTHELSVQIKGFEPAVRRFSIHGDAFRRLEPLQLRLARGRVVGRLVYPDGRSAADLPLRLRPLGGETRSDGDGIFTFVGVHAGEHTLLIDNRRLAAKVKSFRLAQDEYRNLGIIRLKRPAGPQAISQRP